MPNNANWAQVLWVGVLCGIGFTMSLFIGGLAFEGQAAGCETQVKLGVLCGTLVAATWGSALLWRAGRSTAQAR